MIRVPKQATYHNHIQSHKLIQAQFLFLKKTSWMRLTA